MTHRPCMSTIRIGDHVFRIAAITAAHLANGDPALVIHHDGDTRIVPVDSLEEARAFLAMIHDTPEPMAPPVISKTLEDSIMETLRVAREAIGAVWSAAQEWRKAAERHGRTAP